jgi:hypothetical protein
VECSTATETIGGSAITRRISLLVLVVVCRRFIGAFVVAATLTVIRRHTVCSTRVFVFNAGLIILVLLTDLIMLLDHVLLTLSVGCGLSRCCPQHASWLFDISLHVLLLKVEGHQTISAFIGVLSRVIIKGLMHPLHSALSPFIRLLASLAPREELLLSDIIAFEVFLLLLILIGSPGFPRALWTVPRVVNEEFTLSTADYFLDVVGTTTEAADHGRAHRFFLRLLGVVVSLALDQLEHVI